MNLKDIKLGERNQSQKFISIRFNVYNILEVTKQKGWRADEWLSGAAGREALTVTE